MPTDKSIQEALTQRYSLPYFSQHVLKPIFGEHLTVFASSVPMPLNPSETRVATSIKKYGEIKLTDYRQVDLYEVALSESVVVERNKVSIGAVVKKLIAGNNAVLANFYYPDDSGRSWRFSFIAKDLILEGDEVKRVETNPKRYTYILGPNESCKTAGERFSKLSTQSEFTVKAFEEAFSVEKLSKKFFDDYTDHYDSFCDYLQDSVYRKTIFNITFPTKATDKEKDDACKPIRDFVKKLLGRIVFLHFVQKKGWLGASNEKWQDGNRNFIQDLFTASGKKESFYPVWLRKLFYDSLNNPEPKHNDFKLPDGRTVMVPYLNGGLFEDDDPKGVLTFPPRLFEDLFDFFNQYNFTIYEDSPDDHTVAVDPEMLGHIFENLLEDNKDKGAYYTPKEIVHYMCQESLIEYLATKLDIKESETVGRFAESPLREQSTTDITRNDIERFIKSKETTSHIIVHAKEINKHLDDVKICDPAIGSGAFPMGLLQEIFHAKQVLKEIADLPDLRKISNAEMKESIIQNSIYGVDIEKGAVDIARLRFWLSLIVDEELPRPLPNLDYKIVVGDSLLPKLRVGDEDEVVDIDWGAKYTTSANEKLYKKLQADLQELVAKQKKYFSARNEKDKAKLKQTIRDLKIEILTSQLLLDKIKYSSANVVNEELFGAGKKAKQKELEHTLKLAGFDQTLKHLAHLQKHPNKPLQFFDWKLDFPEILNSAIAQREGFDIVIGNPPYLESRNKGFDERQKNDLQIAIQNRWGEDAGLIPRGSDLLIYFLESSLTKIQAKGVIVFITQNSWLDTEYGRQFQNFLLRRTHVKSIIDSDFKYFNDSAGPNINTVVTVFRSFNPFGETTFYRFHRAFDAVPVGLSSLSVEDQNQFVTTTTYSRREEILSRTKWGILLSANDHILELLERLSEKGQFIQDLKGYDLSIGQGLNLSRDYIVDVSIFKSMPFLKGKVIPLFTSADGAPFDIQSTKNGLLDSTRLTSKEEQVLSKEGLCVFDTESSKRKKPILIMPRGLGRHFCALNSCGAYSASCVDVYDNLGNLDEEKRLNLWLFLNSSAAWIVREISGRKNLGGGMLKAEAIDLKNFPLYFELKQRSAIVAIHNKLRKREAMDVGSELESSEHTAIDEIIYGHLSFGKEEVRILNRSLARLVNERSQKSRT